MKTKRPSGVDVNSQPYRKGHPEEVFYQILKKGVDEADRVKEQMRVPAARTPTTVTESLQPLISNTTESELPRTYALGIQIIGDTHYQRCSTTHSLERCPLLKLWLKMVGFEDPK